MHVCLTGSRHRAGNVGRAVVGPLLGSAPGEGAPGSVNLLLGLDEGEHR